MNVNETMRELAQYTRLQKEATAWERRKKNIATQSDRGPRASGNATEPVTSPAADEKGGYTMQAKSKEAAFADATNTVKNSWTFQRLTPAEKAAFEKALNRHRRDINGTYAQRHAAIMAMYSAFLYGVGYTGGNWRTTQEEVLTCMPF